MLAPAFRRNPADGTLNQLKKRLLHTFTADIPCDRDIISLRSDLINLVNVNNAALRLLNVAIRVL